MPVSSGLQKYFDSQQQKKSKRDIEEKFKDLSGKVDPVFLQSFEVFHDKLMGIVDENPEEIDMIADEIESLGKDMSSLQRSHDTAKLKKMVELV